jgi:hypothetical protein
MNTVTQYNDTVQYWILSSFLPFHNHPLLLLLCSLLIHIDNNNNNNSNNSNSNSNNNNNNNNYYYVQACSWKGLPQTP